MRVCVHSAIEYAEDSPFGQGAQSLFCAGKKGGKRRAQRVFIAKICARLGQILPKGDCDTCLSVKRDKSLSKLWL